MDYSTHRSLFYNPYEEPFISFLIEKNNISTDSFSLNEDSSLTLFENVNLVSDLELISFIQNPIVSLAFVMPIQLILASTAVFIQIRTLQMLKQENSVNNRLMTTQSKLHMVLWPTIVVANTLSDNIYPLSEVLTSTFCTALSFHMYFCAISMVLYSFYAALLRYLCCLHTEKVDTFGKTKLFGIIYWAFYLHTFLWTLFTLLTSFNLDHIPLINNCYGDHDRIFLMEGSLREVAKRHFCGLQTTEGK
jgi:hypothetical protein